MEIIRAQREVLKVSLIILGILLIGFSIFNPINFDQSFYFPFVSYCDPDGQAIDSVLIISEIMINPTGIEPGNEWIEIFNRSNKALDLFRYKIGDSEIEGDLEGMYSFPDDALVAAGQPVVIANQATLFSSLYGFLPDYELIESDPAVPNLVKFRLWSGGAINLSNSGDELLLLNQDNKLLDSISWGNSTFAFNPPAPITEDGESLERIPANKDSNSSADWKISLAPDPGGVNLVKPSTPSPTEPNCDNLSILISEVLYDPAFSPEPGGEWMELFNFGTQEVILDCVLLGDEEVIGGSEGMMSFPVGRTIAPMGVIIIANRADDFLNYYGFLPDFEINESVESVHNLSSFPPWATGSINLSNSGDEAILLKKSGSLLDAVSWADSIVAFVPSVPGVEPGHSISRKPADKDTDSSGDWVELSSPEPGTVNLIPPVSPTVTPSMTSTQKPVTSTSTSTPTPTSTPTTTSTQTPTSTETSKPPPSIVINEIQADPHAILGDANNDGFVDYSDDEFIELVNQSSSLIDLSGWSIHDSMESRHLFPEGSVVEPGCGVLVFGGGTPTGNFGNFLVQIASSGRLGLNDRIETIYIYNTLLEQVTSIVYGEEADDGQSITRDPDLIGGTPLRKHSLATGSNGALFSPGTRIDGDFFAGCTR